VSNSPALLLSLDICRFVVPPVHVFIAELHLGTEKRATPGRSRGKSDTHQSIATIAEPTVAPAASVISRRPFFIVC
jgi:hypothetical protein